MEVWNVDKFLLINYSSNLQLFRQPLRLNRFGSLAQTLTVSSSPSRGAPVET